MWEPARYRTDITVFVETRVYSLKQDKLLWAGTSETQNPSAANAVIAELATLVLKEMKKAGVLAK